MTFNPVTTVTDAASTLAASLQGVATAVLPIAAGLLAITIGWKYARKFVK